MMINDKVQMCSWGAELQASLSGTSGQPEGGDSNAQLHQRWCEAHNWYRTTDWTDTATQTHRRLFVHWLCFITIRFFVPTKIYQEAKLHVHQLQGHPKCSCMTVVSLPHFGAHHEAARTKVTHLENFFLLNHTFMWRSSLIRPMIEMACRGTEAAGTNTY